MELRGVSAAFFAFVGAADDDEGGEDFGDGFFLAVGEGGGEVGGCHGA